MRSFATSRPVVSVSIATAAIAVSGNPDRLLSAPAKLIRRFLPNRREYNAAARAPG